jgi:putative phosphoribosyl transferase
LTVTAPPAGPVAPFLDRRTAGRLLGARLRRVFAGLDGSLDLDRPLVLALPRGGVPVGREVAEYLGAPLDVLVTRKIGYPPYPELGVGAIAEGGDPVYDELLVKRLRLSHGVLAPVVERERAELARRVEVYRSGRPPPEVRGRCVILVDDGLATGVTARAGLRALRAAGAARTVLAVPVGAASSAAAMLDEADDVVCLVTPDSFRAVGEWYASFTQLSDSDVLAQLNSRTGRPRAE